MRMRDETTEKMLINIDALNEAIKYVLLAYLLYLILPPLILVRYIDTIDVFQSALKNNIELARKLINDILLYNILYSAAFSATIILLAITIINLNRKSVKLNNILEIELNKKIFASYLIWSAYAIILSIVNIAITLNNTWLIKTQLLESIQKGELLLDIAIEPIRTMIIIHEVLFGASTALYGFALSEIQTNYEIFEKLSLPSKLLVSGGVIFIAEVLFLEIGIGPLLIILGFYLSRKRLEKVKNEIK